MCDGEGRKNCREGKILKEHDGAAEVLELEGFDDIEECGQFDVAIVDALESWGLA